jgi:hypothetical protein
VTFANGATFVLKMRALPYILESPGGPAAMFAIMDEEASNSH